MIEGGIGGRERIEMESEGVGNSGKSRKGKGTADREGRTGKGGGATV